MTIENSIDVCITQNAPLHSYVEFKNCSDDQFSAIIALCFEVYAPQHTSIELCFMSEKEHCVAHKTFLGDATPTDVVAFPYADDDCAGELLVNIEMAVRRAPEFSHSAVAELMLYVVHGTLHLIGFDDHSAADTEKMRTAEKKIITLAIERDIF